MRLIDADALKTNCDIMVGDATIGIRDYVMFHEIDSAPTIDAVEVVRCKDCKYNPYAPRLWDDDDIIDMYSWCHAFMYAFKGEGYCPNAKTTAA